MSDVLLPMRQALQACHAVLQKNWYVEDSDDETEAGESPRQYVSIDVDKFLQIGKGCGGTQHGARKLAWRNEHCICSFHLPKPDTSTRRWDAEIIEFTCLYNGVIIRKTWKISTCRYDDENGQVLLMTNLKKDDSERTPKYDLIADHTSQGHADTVHEFVDTCHELLCTLTNVFEGDIEVVDAKILVDYCSSSSLKKLFASVSDGFNDAWTTVFDLDTPVSLRMSFETHISDGEGSFRRLKLLDASPFWKKRDASVGTRMQSEDDEEETLEDLQCSICMQNKMKLSLTCGHVYCRACLDTKRLTENTTGVDVCARCNTRSRKRTRIYI